MSGKHAKPRGGGKVSEGKAGGTAEASAVAGPAAGEDRDGVTVVASAGADGR